MEIGAEVDRFHGVKRKASDNLVTEQRLAKRFNLLSIGDSSQSTYSALASVVLIRRLRAANNGNNFYIPISATAQQAPPAPTHQPPADDDFMQLENTKDKVYIYNLDAELADTEPQEERLIFIPDIEKHLTKIPKHILTGQPPPQSNELVLYSDPVSLTIPREQDSVRKAIMEARQRARAQNAEQILVESNGVTSPDAAQSSALNGHLTPDKEVETMDDADAMDIG